MQNNRAQQKEKTRRQIITAALNLLSPDCGFSGLSLREVTREAGLAPTSFYRHFQDMEELGLTLVDEGGVALRQLMRKARQRIRANGSVIRTSVETFMEFITDNPNIFRLLLHERSGTSQAFRKAVSREIQYFVVELADYLQETHHFSAQAARVQADAMVILVFNAGAEALDSRSEVCQQLTEKAILQLRFIARGAADFCKPE